MRNILIAPNSFKECSDSTHISQIIYTSFQKHLPVELSKNTSFTVIPISDGGDGFLNVCINNFNLEIISFTISAPFIDHKINCDVGYDKENGIVYIESANILGLKVVPKEQRNPLLLSSKGLGELLLYLQALSKNKKLNINKAVIGIGGTATNDLGIGACSEFGLKVFDGEGNNLKTLPKYFNKIKNISPPTHSLNFDLEIVIDVDNPLMGSNGATETFGMQKGLSNNEIDFVEKGFQNVLSILNIDDNNIESLSGAGGGLAAGLQLFFNAKIKSSKEFIVKDLGINSEKYKFDIVITGEGKFDEQSLFSKGAMVVIDQFINKNTFQYIICGSSAIKDSFNNKVHIVEISKHFNSEVESIKKYKTGIDLAVKTIVNNLIIKE